MDIPREEEENEIKKEVEVEEEMSAMHVEESGAVPFDSHKVF